MRALSDEMGDSTTDRGQSRRASLALGVRAENRVAAALQNRGWTILERNWRARGGELDLVVFQGQRLRFVEVKARKPGDPVGLEAVDPRKRRCLVRAARAYLARAEDCWSEVCFLLAYVEGDRVHWYDDPFDVS